MKSLFGARFWISVSFGVSLACALKAIYAKDDVNAILAGICLTNAVYWILSGYHKEL